MRRIYLTIISLAASAIAVSAQEVVRLSLNNCIEYALKNNYAVKNAKLDEQITGEQVKQTLAATYPHINGKADFTYFNVPQTQFIPARAFNPAASADELAPVAFSPAYVGAASITASQLIFDGSVFVALQARKTVMELSHKTEQVTEESIRYNVFKAYNSLVVAYKQYEIIKVSLNLARSMEHDMEAMYRNGIIEKIDVSRTSVQVNNLATDSIRIGNLLTVSEQVLKYNIGMDINMPILLTDTSLEKTNRTAFALLTREKDYARVPEYALANTALRLSEYNLDRYKLAALPTLSGFWAQGSNYGSNNLTDIFTFNKYLPNSTIGFSLTVPIFNGFLRIHQMKEASLNIFKSQNNIANLKLTIDFQTAAARTSLRNALMQEQSQKRNLELANEVLMLSQKKYKAGVGSNLEVTTAQTELLRAQNNYFTSLLDIINAEADLKKALGLLK